jgi:hexokinase
MLSSIPPVLAAATRIAREFDYPASEVRRGVKEFINQMHEGLSKEGATLSQIPSYVTAVPDGSEKVLSPIHSLSSIRVDRRRRRTKG